LLCCTAVAPVVFVSPDVAGVANTDVTAFYQRKVEAAIVRDMPRINFSNKMISYLGSRFDIRLHTHPRFHFTARSYHGSDLKMETSLANEIGTLYRF